MLPLALGTLLFSCASETNSPLATGEAKLATFSSSIEGNTMQTKASNAAWDANDQIGLFMKQDGAVVNDAENKNYVTASGDGKFAASSTDHEIYFPLSGEVDFTAYYPYQAEAATGTYAVNLADQSSQEAIDLLYSNNATGVASTDEVKLNFNHQLAKVVFEIEAEAPVTTLEGLSVSISALPATAEFNLATGELSAAEAKEAISLKTTIDGLKATAEGIVLPTAALDGRKFTFTYQVEGESKTFEFDASSAVFEKGKKNSYAVKITTLGTAVEKPSGTINDWGAGSSEDITVDTGAEGGKPVEPGVEKTCLNESFGEGTAEDSDLDLAGYMGYDMKAPVVYSYSETGGILLKDFDKGRFDGHGFFLHFDTHDGTSEKDKSFTISGIESEGCENMTLSFDFAASPLGITFSELTLLCNGVEVPLPNQAIANRDRFEPLSISIPNGTTQLEFRQNKATGYMRIDNVKIVGTTTAR